MLGIQKTTVAATVAVHASAAILKATGDGFQFADLFTLAPVVKDAIPVIRGSSDIILEVRDLDAGEADILADAVEAAIGKDFAPGHGREIATRALACVGPLSELFQAIQAARATGGAPKA